MSDSNNNDEYYIKLKNKYDNLYDAACKTINDSISSRVFKLKNSKKDRPRYAPFGITAAVLAVILFCLIFWTQSEVVLKIFFFEILFFNGLFFLILIIRAIHRGRVDEKVLILENSASSQCKTKRQELNMQFKAEYSEYQEHVRLKYEDYKKKYAPYQKGASLQPVYIWLIEIFKHAILTTDRAHYLKKVSAKITYCVNKTGVEILDINNIGAKDSFDFEKGIEGIGRMKSPISNGSEYETYCQQCAYALLLEDICRIAILNAYPKDPSQPPEAPNDAQLLDEHCGNKITLTYVADNSNYIPI